ncbi:MAG: hypothetical protein WBD58_17450 [Geitlerinemataceae cyanobacterium]
MTSQFNSHPKLHLSVARSTGDTGYNAESEEHIPELDDRFDLLSAYLDGEVNAEVRQQVETWLATDAEFRQLHDRMSGLNHSIQSLPVPTPAISASSLADSVFDRDRFELLSAYLDGEVNAEVRQQVETWLATDTEFRQLHDRMSGLNHSIQSLPVPTPAISASSLADSVFDRLDLQRRRRNLRIGGAIAAAFVAVVSGMTLSHRSYTHQMAQSPQQSNGVETETALEGDAQPAAESSNVRSVASNLPSEPSIVSRALFVE